MRDDFDTHGSYYFRRCSRRYAHSAQVQNLTCTFEGWICDRLLHETDPSHPSHSLFQQGCTRYISASKKNTAQRESEVVIVQVIFWSIELREQNGCRNANVEVQNHDVCPLGFPMFFSRHSVSCSHLTGPCLYLASCRSYCSSHLVAGRKCLPCEMLNLKDSRMSITFTLILDIHKAARCRFADSLPLCIFRSGPSIHCAAQSRRANHSGSCA
jgi:hypothetical protein